MTTIASKLEGKYPFILKAIQAHIQRIPTTSSYGRPIDSLITIIQELQTDHFGTIFKEFLKREPIYGFGDLQIEKMIADIKTNSLTK